MTKYRLVSSGSAHLEMTNVQKIVGITKSESKNWHGDESVGLYLNDKQSLRTDDHIKLFKSVWKCRKGR